MRTATIIIAFLIIPFTGVLAQDIIEKDERPIEKPTPFFTVEIGDGDKVLKLLDSILTANGFVISNLNRETREISGTRKIANKDRFEKILLWLEKDFNQPSTHIKIFLLYGIYAKILGEDYARIKIRSEEEQTRIGVIKNAIRNIKN